MPNGCVKLTPAQTAFLRRTVDGFEPERWKATIAGQAGSDRRFIRVTEIASGRTLILVVWDSSDHDWSRFLAIAREFTPVSHLLPRVYADDSEHGLIIEEDLGDMTLRSYCLNHVRTPRDAEGMYRQVIDALVEWQSVSPSLSSTVAGRALDKEMFLWESDYFAEHCVTEYFGREDGLDEQWEDERVHLAEQAAAQPRVCVHRDFQSENVLIMGERVCFVDFQGARLGPASYDLASLLLDPYVDLLSSEQVSQLHHYHARLTGHTDSNAFVECAIQRLMQALGAYANLSLHKGKDRYRAFIPRALKRLAHMLELHGELPAIHKVIEACRRFA